MRVPLAWVREFVDVPSDPAPVAAALGACGFAVDAIDGDVLDLDVTANRPDCLSIYGVARECATALSQPLRPSPAIAPDVDSTPDISVSLDDPGCGRYAFAVADVRVGPSPDWLVSRLAAAGVRAINNIVDVTNYVMLEIGQPMHAFDATRIAGAEIHVRRARSKETITTLDGESRTLDDSMLVIADRDRAVAVAGVMGGATSEVSGATTRIALESAWFVPAVVRATSRTLGLKTEAAARFERGADIAAPLPSIGRALALLEQLGALTGVRGVHDVYPHPPRPRVVELARTRLDRLLGDHVPHEDVVRILGHLGFVVATTSSGWRVTVPTFRVDVMRDADLVEEVGRHWGLDRIPATFPALRVPPRQSDAGVMRGRSIRRVLCGAGLQEAVTFTFIDEGAAGPFSDGSDRVAIKNPLSEKFSVLRPSLVPGLLDSLAYNLNRQAADVRLFEVGSIFSASRGERAAVGWVLTGSRGEHWTGSAGAVGFADAKGIADTVGALLGTPLEVASADDVAWLTKGQRARLLTADGKPAGWVGRLAATRGVDESVFAGELELSALDVTRSGVPTAIRPLPKFPSIVRDLSILVDERLPAADVRHTIRTHAPSTLATVQEFDRYKGKGVPEGQVSLSVRLTFRDTNRTLTDVDVQQSIDRIVAALEQAHGATLRGK